ncbi:hypothetical protein ACIQOF_18990 [Streptomyces sp. NPDC091265]|uniref:hypothetical protein n=1 Tax=unclassified Streptomyces TaxID=2593676 RepID=UPI00344C0765
MTKARTRWPRQRDAEEPVPPGGGTPSLATVRPTELETCLRACAAHSGKLVAGLDRRRAALAEALRNLLATHAAMEQPSSPDASALPLLRRAAKGGPSAALVLGDPLLDPLLAVGNKALDCGYEDELKLAVLVTDTVLTQRRNSRAAWRLRARALEAMGAESDAVLAYERYLDLTDEDGFGIAAKAAGLRAGAERRSELLRTLERDCPEAAAFAGGPVTDTWAEGLALHARGDWSRARSRLIGALLAQERSGAPVPEIQEALAQYVALALEAGGAPGSGAGPRTPAGSPGPAVLAEVIELYAGQRRSRMRGPVADPTFGGVEWTTLGEFRNRIAGKSICLVANSQRVGTGSMGEEIDAYDLVVRFNSYRIEAPATGRRTDIHATIHKHGFNWDQKVHTRLVFGGVSGDWKHSLRNRLVPGAQQYLGDESLRWPLRDIGRVGTDVWPSIPTSGFNMLWLLDHLDVSPRLDLIGFDFYESGAYRLPAAMKMPITSVHEYTSEKAWVMARARSVTDTRIRLR